MSTSPNNCSSCNELKATAPDLIVKGVTEEMEASLHENTGLNPNLTVLHSNEEDIGNMIDCLVARYGQTIDSYDDCDWKDFMKGLMGNIYGIMRAQAASEAGLWDKVEELINGGGGHMDCIKLVLPAEAIYDGYEIPEQCYNSVDATAVYEAGKVAGVAGLSAPAMCAASPAGTNQTITRVLPAGVYNYRWICTKNAGSADNVSGCSINYGNGSASFNNGSTGTEIASGDGHTGTGTFGFAEDTEVTISAYGHANPGMGWAMICVYTA